MTSRETLPRWQENLTSVIAPRTERKDSINLAPYTRVEVQQEPGGSAFLMVYGSVYGGALPREGTPEGRRNTFLRFALTELEVALPILRSLVAEIQEP